MVLSSFSSYDGCNNVLPLPGDTLQYCVGFYDTKFSDPWAYNILLTLAGPGDIVVTWDGPDGLTYTGTVSASSDDYHYQGTLVAACAGGTGPSPRRECQCVVTAQSANATDVMRAQVDEIDVPTDTLLRWEWRPTDWPPWGHIEGAGGTAIWTRDHPRGHVYKVRSRVGYTIYTPQYQRLIAP